MVRTYRIPKYVVYAVAGFSLVWCGGLIASLIAHSPSLPDGRVEISLSLVWILVALLPVGYLFVVYEVTLSDDGTCEFRSVLRRRSVRAQQIVSISTDEEAIYVRYPGGRVHMWETREFPDLVRCLKELNPAIELQGWVQEALAKAPPEDVERKPAGA